MVESTGVSMGDRTGIDVLCGVTDWTGVMAHDPQPCAARVAVAIDIGWHGLRLVLFHVSQLAVVRPLAGILAGVSGSCVDHRDVSGGDRVVDQRDFAGNGSACLWNKIGSKRGSFADLATAVHRCVLLGSQR